jgi:hypothetical protein
MRQAAHEVARLCHDRVGRNLRSVTVYDESGLEAVYQRPGLREAYDETQVAALVETARSQNEVLHESGVEEAPLGRPRAGVYAFEKAFVLQFPVTESRGLVVTMDADVGTTLGTFIGECLDAMATAGEDVPGVESG